MSATKRNQWRTILRTVFALGILCVRVNPLEAISTVDSVGRRGTSANYTTGTVSGYYHGANNSTTMLVLDTNPDNYGLYANDGVADSWQIRYFGLSNPSGEANADADGTGQNNLVKYLAGLDPTNPASV